MELVTTLAISAAMLGVLLLILLIVWALSPAPRRRENNDVNSKEELKHIKEEIENEAMDKVVPYKPARLNKPNRKRL